jgi:hypothetical protein
MRKWVLLACLSFGVAACDDGDDLEKKDAGPDVRSVDTATADTGTGTDTGGDRPRDGTDAGAATDGLADRVDSAPPTDTRPPDVATTEGGDAVDAADTAGTDAVDALTDIVLPIDLSIDVPGA